MALPNTLRKQVGPSGALAFVLIAAAAVSAQEPAQPASPGVVPGCATHCPFSLDQLACMDWPSLEALYRQANTGSIPVGYVRGRAIYCPDQALSGAKSAVVHVLWHGKDFDCASGTLVNQWLGVKAIQARVCRGTSWLDGRPSIIMDYRGTSWVWNDVRDELREVAPGLYLGIMYRCKSCGPRMQMFFALEAPGCAPCPCR